MYLHSSMNPKRSKRKTRKTNLSNPTIEMDDLSSESNQYENTEGLREEVEVTGDELLDEVTLRVKGTIADMLKKHDQAIRSKYEDHIMNLELEAATHDMKKNEMKKQLDKKISFMAKQKQALHQKKRRIALQLTR